MTPVIQAENLGKRYRIGEALRYRTLREAIVRSALAPVRAARLLTGPTVRGPTSNGAAAPEVRDHIWALKGVGFELQQGEVLGIIGRNGAGKSTLLKVLARITDPTTGWVELHGRVGSLLEVGTGFHGELSGRENIYLNGAIMGMKRREIGRKFDEIVAFAEVEKFVDTPLKHYSSGMQARLAFAVAAHLEPEILIVDEVLAVGDIAFQKKCLGKMHDVSREGRTVLFVSHNMAAIESLCNSCLMLVEGELVAQGKPAEVVQRYLTTELRSEAGPRALAKHPGRTGNSVPIMRSVAIFSGAEDPTAAVRMGAPMSVGVTFNYSSQPLYPYLGVTVKNAQGEKILTVNNDFLPSFELSRPVSAGTITCDFKWLPLMPGTYVLDLFMGANPYEDLDVIHDAISFEVLPADFFGTGKLPEAAWGLIFWPATWRLEDNEPVVEPGRERSAIGK